MSTTRKLQSQAAIQVGNAKETGRFSSTTMLFTLHSRDPENPKLYFAADFFVKTKSRSRYLCGSQRAVNLTRVIFISHCDVFQSSQQASPEPYGVGFLGAIARPAANTSP
jgi:hypothetical protein